MTTQTQTTVQEQMQMIANQFGNLSVIPILNTNQVPDLHFVRLSRLVELAETIRLAYEKSNTSEQYFELSSDTYTNLTLCIDDYTHKFADDEIITFGAGLKYVFITLLLVSLIKANIAVLGVSFLVVYSLIFIKNLMIMLLFAYLVYKFFTPSSSKKQISHKVFKGFKIIAIKNSEPAYYYDKEKLPYLLKILEKAKDKEIKACKKSQRKYFKSLKKMKKPKN